MVLDLFGILKYIHFFFFFEGAESLRYQPDFFFGLITLLQYYNMYRKLSWFTLWAGATDVVSEMSGI